mgnify:CR=1 FL=1
MRSSFVAIALALTLTSVLATYTTNNYVKAPVVVVQDDDLNFTNKTSLSLASITVGDLHLLSILHSKNSGNSSASNWNLWWKKLDAKTFTSSGDNFTAQFTNPQEVIFYNNYAIGLDIDNDTGIPQVRAYQVPLTGGAALPRLQITSNNNQSFTPKSFTFATIGKTAYIFYMATYQTVNVTSFQIGSSTLGREFTFTDSTTFQRAKNLSVVWGESLGNNHLFATWERDDNLWEYLIDVSNGAVRTPVFVNSYNKDYDCSIYATDKKWYGELCSSTDKSNGTINYYVRRTDMNFLVLLAQYSKNTSALVNTFPYGPHLVMVFLDSVSSSSQSSQSYSYEIWNLETRTLFKTRTQFLTIDSNSSFSFYSVPAGGLYTLLWDNNNADKKFTNVKVGLLLGSSYLSSVLGFLLTIIASLLLF